MTNAVREVTLSTWTVVYISLISGLIAQMPVLGSTDIEVRFTPIRYRQG